MNAARRPFSVALFFAIAAAFTLSAAVPEHSHLRVKAGGRYLERGDGTPFFYLGDTAWRLLTRLDRPEIDRYLADRARKGFTVIQVVALLRPNLEVPNANGDLPFVEKNVSQPNASYFEHLDYIIDRAAASGLFVGLLPSWSSHWRRGVPSPSMLTEANAGEYGRFLGRRYASKPIIWILGGDGDILSSAELGTVKALAQGLRDGDGGAHLITFHPYGPGQSSTRLADAEWIDFHMVQSSHGSRDHDNGLAIERDYALQPPKPTLDGEPRYEGMPVGFYFQQFNRHDRFDDYDVRQAAYWSLLAGACGYTYGNNNVYSFWQPGAPTSFWSNQDWRDALDAPGAWQMRYIRRLFESRPFTDLVPEQSMLVDAPRDGGAKVRAARARDGSFAFIYSPRGEPFTVNLGAIKADRINEIWFDPRYGTSFRVLGPHPNGRSIQTYTPVTQGRGQDWLLVLEDADRKFHLPGSAAVTTKAEIR